jgi:hypothetical protein
MKKTILIAAVLFFALSLSAFGQVAYTVASEQLAKIACCGLAEPTGTISFTTQFGTINATVSGTITATYNVPIANPTSVNIKAIDSLGVDITPAGLTATATGSIVVISVPVGIPSPHSLVLSNVRVDVSGSGFCNTSTGVVAAVTSNGNRLTVGETTNITTVLSIGPALTTPTVVYTPTSGAETSIDASNGTVTGASTITVSEAFFTAFGTAAVETGRTQRAVIRLKLAGIPTGVSILFPTPQGNWETSNADGSAASGAYTVTKTSSPYVYYRQTVATNPGTPLEALVVTPTITAVAPYPLAPAAITVSAALGPIKSAGPANLFPQYLDNCETTAVEFAKVQGVLTTTLLVPYAVQAIGYQTGLVVSNTTKDPGTVAMGQFTTAIPQSGKIAVYFYPSDTTKTVATWVSTAHPTFGSGLDSNGLLPAGGQFTAMLNQLFPTGTTDFSGYLFIVTDFTNAHGEFFISDFDNFTHGALMLVVNDANRFASGAGRTQEQGLNQ